MNSPHRSDNWYRLYVGLVILSVSVITGGVYLSCSIKDNYTRSVQANQEWVDRLAVYADLTLLAAAVNAPGNDVFDTRQVEDERSRRDSARLAFDRAMREARDDLLANVTPADAAPLLGSLAAANGLMRALVEDSEQIFALFRQGETGAAAAFMASMDRRYAQLAARMTALGKQVGVLQTRAFEAQVQAMRQMEKLEQLMASLLVIMVTSVTFYGYKAVQRLYAGEEQLARYSDQLAKARDAANASNKAKSDFLAVLSHEIRTPLTTVLGSADLLAVAELPERTRGHVNAIQASGRHLLAIVNDVLDFSRIEAVGVHLDQVDFTVTGLLEHVQWLMGPAAADKGIHLQFDNDVPAGRALRGDPTRLRQVLLNLVSNAVKFTAQGGVVVHLSEQPEADGRIRLRIAVQDTGIGISADRQAGLFVPFSQAADATARRYGGTGLGLAICRRLVEAMGGDIGAESSPGQGSRFWFDVPFELGEHGRIEQEVAFGPVACARLRILVVEDAQLNRHLLGEVLTRQGHEVAEAAHGAEALDLLARRPFDVVLMDVQMPVMDGIEATRRIRALPMPVRDMPVVGLTANVLEDVRQKCFAAGMNSCLSKPFAWSELFVTLAQVTAGSDSVVAGSASLPSEGDAPLFDRFGLDLSANQTAEGLLPQVIEDAERSCMRLRTGIPRLEDVRQEAHKLKGTAGLFGLKRIQQAAKQLGKSAADGDDVDLALDDLAAAVFATRLELEEKGLMAAGPEVPPAPSLRQAGPARPEPEVRWS